MQGMRPLRKHPINVQRQANVERAKASRRQSYCDAMEGGRLLLLVIATAVSVISTTSAAYPPFFEEILRKCSFTSEKSIDACFVNLLEGARPHLPKGITEWKMPPLEPLEVKSVWVKHDSGGHKIKGEFTNLLVRGLTQYKVEHVRTIPAENEASIGLKFPKVDIEGTYNITGSLFLISMKGDGPFYANLTSVHTDTKCVFETSRPAGPQGDARIHLAKTKTDFNFGDIKLRLENLFHGDRFLGETVNIFLNEHARSLVDEISPQLSNEIDKVLIQLFDEAAAAIPAAKWEKLANTQSPSSSSHH